MVELFGPPQFCRGVWGPIIRGTHVCDCRVFLMNGPFICTKGPFLALVTLVVSGSISSNDPGLFFLLAWDIFSSIYVQAVFVFICKVRLSWTLLSWILRLFFFQIW